MRRTSRHHRPLARLALLAVLLLALAPAAGRLLSAASAQPQLLAGWSQLCTAAGLQSLPGPADPPGWPAPAGAHQGEDCPYCPLAAQLWLPPLAAVAAVGHAAAAVPAARAAPRRRFRRLHGPGSRGPPAGH